MHEPEGPHDLLTFTKRTLTLACVAILSVIFCLVIALYVSYHVYKDARGDLTLIRSQNECARQINADTVVAQGEFLQGLGELDKQIAVVFSTLGSIQANPDAFNAAVSEFNNIASELDRLNGLLDQALSATASVNATCANPTKGEAP